jgi:hypothetical protein
VWFPTFETVGRPQIAIPFDFTLPAAIARYTLVTSRIPFKYRITRIGLGCAAIPAIPLQASIFTARTAALPTTTPPTDTNVFTPFSPTPYWSLVNFFYIIDMNFVPSDDEQFIKVHIWNQVAVANWVFIVIWIEEVV